ncbi:MAG: ABC transporter permease [Candidatus Brocadiia bacterium]
MRNILTLVKKELALYFYSPLAYVVICAFLFFSGYFFWLITRDISDANSLRYVLETVGFISLFFSPMITMRLLAEEKRSGTLEMLMTVPVTETQVVVSKYLSALLFFIFLNLPTMGYVVLLYKWGNPDGGALIAGYAGLFCLTGIFLAIGLFVSSFTSNQIIAAVITFVILLVVWVFGWLGSSVSSPWKEIFQYIGFFDHYESFRKGLIDSRDLVYCLSSIVFFMFLTVRMLEARRWR